MKKGYKVIDADTHVTPSFEVLEKYMDPSFRPRRFFWDNSADFFRDVE
jgi:hypothetical protein